MYRSLMMSMEFKIKKARSHLSHGIHDPKLMKEIDIISHTLNTCMSFEKSLIESNMDID
jgi:hypothetical protein